MLVQNPGTIWLTWNCGAVKIGMNPQIALVIGRPCMYEVSSEQHGVAYTQIQRQSRPKRSLLPM
jgi:hypothetical protein